jgi:predicted nucleotidyltransferase
MNNLSKYLSYGYNTKIGKIASLILPDNISIYFNDITNKIESNHSSNDLIILNQVESNNSFVNQIKNICQNSNLEGVISCYVFGSIASNDTNSYSDFDGILIYDEHKLHSKNQISQLRRLIKQINLYSHLQDSLQHHGIIVIGINELANKNDELIFNLLKEALVIYGGPAQGKQQENRNCYTGPFIKLKKSILHKLSSEEKWTNQYFFKNMLSELLLYPCSYLQFKNQKYISKKDSFEIIKDIFNQQDIQTINQLEQIRLNWEQEKLNESSINQRTIAKFKKTQKTSIKDIETMISIKPRLIELLNSRQ